MPWWTQRNASRKTGHNFTSYFLFTLLFFGRHILIQLTWENHTMPRDSWSPPDKQGRAWNATYLLARQERFCPAKSTRFQISWAFRMGTFGGLHMERTFPVKVIESCANWMECAGLEWFDKHSNFRWFPLEWKRGIRLKISIFSQDCLQSNELHHLNIQSKKTVLLSSSFVKNRSPLYKNCVKPEKYLSGNSAEVSANNF